MNNQKWILLAEDNLNDADLAVRALSAHQNGELVVVAHDGAEAMAPRPGSSPMSSSAINWAPTRTS